MSMKYAVGSTEDRLRFYTDVQDTNQCWLWRGATNEHGYGVLNVQGKSTLAHRVAYQTWVGDIPDGCVVMHVCDTPPCVNPNHLRSGTQGENVRDMFDKQRVQRPRGENHPGAKLTWSDVREIRAFADSGVARQALADAYGVRLTAIARIVNHTTWKDLLRG